MEFANGEIIICLAFFFVLVVTRISIVNKGLGVILPFKQNKY